MLNRVVRKVTARRLKVHKELHDSYWPNKLNPTVSLKRLKKCAWYNGHYIIHLNK
jgi:hypothetical protein